MANLKDIRKRIASVKNTQQITKAMKMVAAAKLRKAQEAAFGARPHSMGIERILAEVVRRGGENDEIPTHPLLEKRDPIHNVELLVLTSDRGLCGGFNSNVLKRAGLFLADNGNLHETISVAMAGRKGAEYFKRRKQVRKGKYHERIFDGLCYERAIEISEDWMERYLSASSELDAVYVVYNSFVSAIKQEVILKRLLPVEPPEQKDSMSAGLHPVDFKYEPDMKTVLDALVPKYIVSKLWHALLESVASEHAARMTAMDSATRNAGDMIDSLTLLANRTRQAVITTELVEIVSGAEAL